MGRERRTDFSADCCICEPFPQGLERWRRSRASGVLPKMRLEELVRELFRLHDLNANGVLEERELVKLNEKIAMLHYGKDVDLVAVRKRYRKVFRERLDSNGDPVPYSTYRSYLYKLLNDLDPEIQAQEMIMERFIAEAQAGRQCFNDEAYATSSDAEFRPWISFSETFGSGPSLANPKDRSREHSPMSPTASRASRPSQSKNKHSGRHASSSQPALPVTARPPGCGSARRANAAQHRGGSRQPQNNSQRRQLPNGNKHCGRAEQNRWDLKQLWDDPAKSAPAPLRFQQLPSPWDMPLLGDAGARTMTIPRVQQLTSPWDMPLWNRAAATWHDSKHNSHDPRVLMPPRAWPTSGP